eukprot:1530733-Prymnesium_polylepis.1
MSRPAAPHRLEPCMAVATRAGRTAAALRSHRQRRPARARGAVGVLGAPVWIAPSPSASKPARRARAADTCFGLTGVSQPEKDMLRRHP